MTREWDSVIVFESSGSAYWSLPYSFSVSALEILIKITEPLKRVHLRTNVLFLWRIVKLHSFSVIISVISVKCGLKEMWMQSFVCDISLQMFHHVLDEIFVQRSYVLVKYVQHSYALEKNNGFRNDKSGLGCAKKIFTFASPPVSNFEIFLKMFFFYFSMLSWFQRSFLLR